MRRAAAILGLLAVVLAPCGFLYQSGTATYPTASPTFAATPFFTGALTTAQTVKASQANLYGVSLWVQGWDTVNAFDVENGAASSASLFAIPSITPSQTGDVVLAGLTNADAGAFPFTIDSSLSTQDSQSAAVGMDGIVAYLVYNSTTALSPTWSASSGPFEAAYAQIAFQGSGGGGATSCTLASSGWGKC